MYVLNDKTALFPINSFWDPTLNLDAGVLYVFSKFQTSFSYPTGIEWKQRTKRRVGFQK